VKNYFLYLKRFFKRVLLNILFYYLARKLLEIVRLDAKITPITSIIRIFDHSVFMRHYDRLARESESNRQKLDSHTVESRSMYFFEEWIIDRFIKENNSLISLLTDADLQVMLGLGFDEWFDLIEERYEEYIETEESVQLNMNRAEKLFRDNYLD
jgi:hypothetical protein